LTEYSIAPEPVAVSPVASGYPAVDPKVMVPESMARFGRLDQRTTCSGFRILIVREVEVAENLSDAGMVARITHKPPWNSETTPVFAFTVQMDEDVVVENAIFDRLSELLLNVGVRVAPEENRAVLESGYPSENVALLRFTEITAMEEVAVVNLELFVFVINTLYCEPELPTVRAPVVRVSEVAPEILLKFELPLGAFCHW
jgi:hypothetical protein